MSCTAVYHFQLEISTLDLWIVLSFSAACDQIRIDVYHAGRSDPAVPRRCGEKKSQRLPGQPAAAVSTPRGPEHRSVLRRLVDFSTVFLTRTNITLVLRLAFGRGKRLENKGEPASTEQHIRASKPAERQ